MNQRVAKSVSDLFLIGEDNVGLDAFRVLMLQQVLKTVFLSIQEGWNQANM